MKTAHEYLLEKAGFDIAGPEIWGKPFDALTAFVEVGEQESSAWLWNPDEGVFVGQKQIIKGEPEAAVIEALRHIEGLLSEDAYTGDVPRTFPVVIENGVAPALPA